jgi:hypothetical protein
LRIINPGKPVFKFVQNPETIPAFFGEAQEKKHRTITPG